MKNLKIRPRCGRRHLQLARTKGMSPRCRCKVLLISPKTSKKFGKLLMEREEEIETVAIAALAIPIPIPVSVPVDKLHPPGSLPSSITLLVLTASVCVFSLPFSTAPHPRAVPDYSVKPTLLEVWVKYTWQQQSVARAWSKLNCHCQVSVKPHLSSFGTRVWVQSSVRELCNYAAPESQQKAVERICITSGFKAVEQAQANPRQRAAF